MKINLEKWKSFFPDDAIAIEISGHGRDAQKNYELGFYNIWTHTRIHNVFNNGKGRMCDFNNYIDNNKQFCTIVYI